MELSIGRIVYDTWKAESNLAHSREGFSGLKPSSKRLWEAAGNAAAAARKPDDIGEVAYRAYFGETGLPLAHFLRWDELGPSLQRIWTAAGLAAANESGRKVAA